MVAYGGRDHTSTDVHRNHLLHLYRRCGHHRSTRRRCTQRCNRAGTVTSGKVWNCLRLARLELADLCQNAGPNQMTDNIARNDPGTAVDAGRVLDEGRWSRYQTFLILATALTIILDGVDNQLLPNAIPTLIKEWGQARPAWD